MKDTLGAVLYMGILALIVHYGLGTFIDFDKMNEIGHEYAVSLFSTIYMVLWKFKDIVFVFIVIFMIAVIRELFNRQKP